MKVRSEFRDRPDVEVAILDALADRLDEGMTVFELRSRVMADIDDLEVALQALKDDGLINAEDNGQRTVIIVDDRVVPDEPVDDASKSIVETIREMVGF